MKGHQSGGVQFENKLVTKRFDPYYGASVQVKKVSGNQQQSQDVARGQHGEYAKDLTVTGQGFVARKHHRRGAFSNVRSNKIKSLRKERKGRFYGRGRCLGCRGGYRKYHGRRNRHKKIHHRRQKVGHGRRHVGRKQVRRVVRKVGHSGGNRFINGRRHYGGLGFGGSTIKKSNRWANQYETGNETGGHFKKNFAKSGVVSNGWGVDQYALSGQKVRGHHSKSLKKGGSYGATDFFGKTNGYGQRIAVASKQHGAHHDHKETSGYYGADSLNKVRNSHNLFGSSQERLHVNQFKKGGKYKHDYGQSQGGSKKVVIDNGCCGGLKVGQSYHKSRYGKIKGSHDAYGLNKFHEKREVNPYGFTHVVETKKSKGYNRDHSERTGSVSGQKKFLYKW